MNVSGQPLHLLLVEDNPDDARLVLRELTEGGFNVTATRVMNAREMNEALGQPWDVVLCDYSLPQFSGEMALRMVRDRQLDTPVIFVSGVMGEETAVNAMRLGASDYVMKDHLARLVPAVQRELREAAIRREARRADLNLRESEHKYRHLFESLNDGAFLFAATTGMVIDTNVAAQQLLRAQRQEIVGRRFADFFSPRLPDERLKAGDGGDLEFEAEIERRDREQVPVRVSLSNVELHERPFVLALVHDVTAHRQAQEALRASEERFSRVFSLSPTGICVIRAADGRFVDVNAAFVALTGYSREELLGHSSEELGLWMDPNDRTAAINALKERVTLGAHRIHGRRRDGRAVAGLAASTVMTLNGEQYYLSLIHDVTELQRSEEARRESEERFRQVTENIGEVFWLTDVGKSRFIYVSPAYEKIWGRTCDSLYREPMSWIEAVHPADRAVVRGAISEQAAGTYDQNYRIVRPDGAVRWIHDRAFPIADTTGVIYRVAGIAEDITERRQLEEQFRQAQKMEAIGQLAGGIAHDFNNLLTIVAMQCSMLQDDLRQNTSAQSGLQQVLDAVTRGVGLTRQLLTFSRREMKEEARAVDLCNQLASMVKLLHRILGEQIEVQTRLPAGLPQVLADPGKMEQVLMNLVINARDAMPNGGKLSVSVELANVDEAHAARNRCARVGEFVQLTVSDTGCGIPPEHITRIFEPFFTTKEVGKGTGLGLATVFGIVQQHRGWIEVDSMVDVGTSFRVFIPALRQSVAQAADAAPTKSARRGTETIAIVEDEDVLRTLAAEALRREGYRVTAARTGAEALRLLAAEPQSVALLVTDLVMPGGVSGQCLAAQLRQKYPELKVVFSTGYSAEVVGKLPLRSGWDYLPKPYSIRDLTTIVRTRLDGPAEASAGRGDRIRAPEPAPAVALRGSELPPGSGG